MGKGTITSASGLVFLFAIMYVVYNSPTVDLGSMEWFYKSMTITIAVLLGLILVGLGNIISGMDK